MRSNMTACSLVGMTMGARKRAWLSNALYPVVFPSGIITDETEMQAGYSWPEIRDDWPLLGERLRPCPGCCACKSHILRMRELKRAYPATAQQHPQHLRRIIERQSWRCGVRIMNPDDSEHLHRTDVHCDGSGVLPARKSK